MSENFTVALAALDSLDAEPIPGEDETYDLIRNAHREIARGLGLTVFPPSNYPYDTVSDRPDANPYSRERNEVWPMPDYSESFEAAVTLAPTGAELVLVQVGQRWKAAYKPAARPEPDPAAWRESNHPARAIARAALAARLAA